MPFTPYHFGINALPGLGSRGRLDMFVLMAANVIIDTEVLADSYFAAGWPTHQIWHFHTLLIGGLVGAVLGAAIYAIKPLRMGCGSFNSLLGFSHLPGLFSMILSGLIGAWLHVLIDGLFHYDVQVFWPIQDNLLYRQAHSINWLHTLLIHQGIIRLCLIGWVLACTLAAVFLYKHLHVQKIRLFYK